MSPHQERTNNDEPVHSCLTRHDVVLDGYNCDLTMIVKDDCLRGQPMIDHGLCSLWSGIRATYGMNQGRVAFQIKVLRQIHCSDLLHNEIPSGVRIGWSLNGSQLCLGEELLSYGYEGSGKIWTRHQFEWYGEQYSIGDTITCYADFESESGSVSLSFAKNDLDFNLAYRIDYEQLHSRPLFPHIYIKNISFQVNFGQLNTKFPLRSGFRFINAYHEDERIRSTLGPSSKEECEVIMMVGLPGAGKSLWVERHRTMNPDKNYLVLSTNTILNQMQVNSKQALGRTLQYADDRLDHQEMLDRATQCLKTMLKLAVCRKRNYIIDQTNVFGSARRRQMSLFDGFYRRAVVVIPNDNEYQRRRYQQQIDQNKFTPDSFVHQMQAKFDLPDVGDVFDDVEYAELAFRDARDLVMKYRHQHQMTKETSSSRSHNHRNDKIIDLSYKRTTYSSRFHSKPHQRYNSSHDHHCKRRKMDQRQ